MTWDDVYAKAEKLISIKAYQWQREEHFALNREDLIAEGWLAYSALLASTRSRNLEPLEFWKIFTSSLHGHMWNLYRDHKTRAKRAEGERAYAPGGSGHDVDLSDIFEFIGAEGFELCLIDEYCNEVRSIIKDNANLLELFEVLINPPAEVEDMALATHKRRCRLHAQGQHVRGLNLVAPDDNHFAKFLGWSSSKLYKYRKQLEHIVERVIQLHSNGMSSYKLGHFTLG